MNPFKARIWHDPPGHRFRRYYYARHSPEANTLNSTLRIVAGGVLVVIGVAFLVLPGPGIPPLIFGAALLAGESLGVARWLDSIELKLRRRLPPGGEGDAPPKHSPKQTE